MGDAGGSTPPTLGNVPRFNEIGLNLFFTTIIAGTLAGTMALRLSKLYGTPTYRILGLIYVHQLIYCYCQQILNGYTLLIPLNDYNVWYLLMVKFVECYSKNAYHLYDLVSALMYLDITRASGTFRIKDICQSKKRHFVLNVIIFIICIISASVAIGSSNGILARTNYMFVGSNDPVLLQIIIYSFGWPAIFCCIVLIFKWYDFWHYRTKADGNAATSSTTSTVRALKLSAIICTVQNLFALCITVIPGLFGINQTVDPWISAINISSVIAMPFHSFIPFHIALMDKKKCICGASREGTSSAQVIKTNYESTVTGRST
jgi:hypothetical protein